MRAASRLRLKLRSLFARRRMEQELDEELRYHVERQVEEGIAAGMTSEEARYAALRSIKDIEQRKEECRDMRGIGWVEDFVSDLQYASRQLLKNKSFFAIAAVTLALGIGANTAIFSAVNTVLLRPFPYRQADRLVDVWCTVAAKGIPKMGCALPDLREIATRNHSFEAVANAGDSRTHFISRPGNQCGPVVANSSAIAACRSRVQTRKRSDDVRHATAS